MSDDTPAGRKALLETELDQASFPEFRDRILAAESEVLPHSPRSYPGYPTVELPRPRTRPLTRLDSVLKERTSVRTLSEEPMSKAALARLLHYGHGVVREGGHGPAPSAGKLFSVELYLCPFAEWAWLPHAWWHYDRAGNHLSRLANGLDRDQLEEIVPSFVQFAGGAGLIVLAGDLARLGAKYGDRAGRFVLLEAGHIMQNLCLVGWSISRPVLPLGGFFDRELQRSLGLPPGDSVLYVAGF